MLSAGESRLRGLVGLAFGVVSIVCLNIGVSRPVFYAGYALAIVGGAGDQPAAVARTCRRRSPIARREVGVLRAVGGWRVQIRRTLWLEA